MFKPYITHTAPLVQSVLVTSKHIVAQEHIKQRDVRRKQATKRHQHGAEQGGGHLLTHPTQRVDEKDQQSEATRWERHQI